MMFLPLLSTLVATAVRLVPAVASPAGLFAKLHPQQDYQRPSEDLLIATLPDEAERRTFVLETFSTDGKSGFYPLRREGKRLLFRDTDSLGEFDSYSVFQRGIHDGAFTVGRTQTNESFLVLPSSKMLGPYEDIDCVWGNPPSTSGVWLARRNDKESLIEKDREVATYDAIEAVTRSKDGGALAF